MPEVLKTVQAECGDKEIAASMMTAWELLQGVRRASKPAIRVRRQEFVEEILDRIPFHPLDLNTARIAAEVDTGLRSQGERIATADLMIASTALNLDFTLVTANIRHFRRVSSLMVFELDLDGA